MSKKCTNPEIGRLLARYEFGKVTKEEKIKFERHLLECEACYKEYYSFLPVTETIKNNIKDFQQAARLKRRLSDMLRNKIITVMKRISDKVSAVPGPVKVAIPAIALIVIFIIGYFLGFPGHYNNFRLIVQEDSEELLLHPPENIASKAYGDSLSGVKYGNIAEKDNYIELFMKRMFIEKYNERRALIFRWPQVKDINYYQHYLSQARDQEVISPVKTLTDTLFMYPIENIPKNQTIVWNLIVCYKDGNKFIVTKKFKINY